MATKRKLKPVKSQLEKEVIKIVETHQKELTKKDVQEIVNDAMPNIDRMVAKHVKDHFTAIAAYIENSFKA